MHWLIPLISHSLSSLLAWKGRTLSLAALLVSFALAATQSIHLWAIFYGLFGLDFVVGTCLAILTHRRQQPDSLSQQGQSGPWTRTAASLSANILVAALLVPLHQYYLKTRLKSVPWFHLFRARAGCLPVPSRTLIEPFQYTWVDALGNQLPYGAVCSYAVALACTLSFSVGGRGHAHGLTTSAILAGALGALLVALTAAYGLPMCGEEARDGKHQVMMHVDRSSDWKERTEMTWSSEARYGSFVVFVTLVGTTGAVLAAQLTAAFHNGTTRARPASTSAAPDAKPASSPSDGKATATSEKASDGKTMAEGSQLSLKGGSDNGVGSASSNRRHIMVFCTNLLLSVAVVLSMAIWSWTGPRVKKQEP